VSLDRWSYEARAEQIEALIGLLGSGWAATYQPESDLWIVDRVGGAWVRVSMVHPSVLGAVASALATAAACGVTGEIPTQSQIHGAIVVVIAGGGSSAADPRASGVPALGSGSTSGSAPRRGPTSMRSRLPTALRWRKQ